MAAKAVRATVPVDVSIGKLASRQQGTFSRRQVLAAGGSDAGINRRVNAGRCVRVLPGVYIVEGSAASWLRDVWCGLLATGPDTVVSHETALRLHGIADIPPWPVTLTVPHGRGSTVPRLRVHQIDDLRPAHVTRVRGLPVSRPDRAIVEVAATFRSRRLGRVLDDAVAARLASYTGVARCLGDVARRGKPGVRRLGEVLDDRGDGYVPPASDLERALFDVLAAGGLPEPRRQVPLPGPGAVVGVADAAYVDERVLLEADGRRWHSRIQDLKRDRLRDAEAARVGWLTLRFLYEQVRDEPAEVCATVADVLRQRGGFGRPASFSME